MATADLGITAILTTVVSGTANLGLATIDITTTVGAGFSTENSVTGIPIREQKKHL